MSLKKIHRAGAAFVAVVGLMLLSGASALANGPPVAKVTERLVNEATTDIGVHPCTGQAAELTLVETGVIHFSAFADGTVHFTGTLRGALSADALPADGSPEATGTFVHWFGGNGMLLEEGGALRQGRRLVHGQRQGHERRWLHLHVPSERAHRLRRRGRPEAGLLQGPGQMPVGVGSSRRALSRASPKWRLN